MVLKNAGKVVGTSITTLSDDGKVFTQVMNAVTFNGATFSSTAVFERQ